MSRINRTLMDASLITKCRNMCFPEFSGDGEYLKIHDLQNITSNLGGPRDDFENHFTARLLLLLESLSIYNDSLYERVLRELTGCYFRDYQGHEGDFRPIFLVNHILRFWKTLCLNYEHSRNNFYLVPNEVQKSHLKNLKMNFSRMLTSSPLVILLAVPRECLNPKSVSS